MSVQAITEDIDFDDWEISCLRNKLLTGFHLVAVGLPEHLAQAAAERLPEVGQLAPKLHADFGAGFAKNAPQLGFVVTLLLEESANRKHDPFYNLPKKCNA